MMSDMARDTSDIQMAINMRAIFRWEKLMEKASICGSMEKYMTGNGKMVLKMAMEYGGAFLVILISVSGKIAKRTDMESTSGKMEIDLRASGKIV